VRHQAGDAPVAIQKRVDPQESVVRAGGGKEGLRLRPSASPIFAIR
jgi:hypothetical protein